LGLIQILLSFCSSLLLFSIFTLYPTVQEEAFMAVGALADQMEKPFIKYMEAFLPILVQGLSNNAEYQVCAIGRGLWLMAGSMSIFFVCV